MPATTNPVIIAQRIRRLATALIVTQGELAALFGVSHLTIRRWATAAQVPTLRHQRVLEQLEGINADRIARVPLAPYTPTTTPTTQPTEDSRNDDPVSVSA